LKIEILNKTREVLKDPKDGEEFVFETAVVQIGLAHKWLFMTNNDWLVCYKLEIIPGVEFKPVELETVIIDYFSRNKHKLKKSEPAKK
jgi:hypothetical protein